MKLSILIVVAFANLFSEAAQAHSGSGSVECSGFGADLGDPACIDERQSREEEHRRRQQKRACGNHEIPFNNGCLSGNANESFLYCTDFQGSRLNSAIYGRAGRINRPGQLDGFTSVIDQEYPFKRQEGQVKIYSNQNRQILVDQRRGLATYQIYDGSDLVKEEYCVRSPSQLRN